MTEGKRRKDRKKGKKKKKKEKIPWYLQEELMKEQAEKARQEREAEEARKKMEEEQRWFESLSPAEKEKVEVKRSTETRRAFWQQFYEAKSDEEAAKKRQDEQIRIMRSKRKDEKLERQKLAEAGQLELEYKNILIEKVMQMWNPPHSSLSTNIQNHVYISLHCAHIVSSHLVFKLQTTTTTFTSDEQHADFTFFFCKQSLKTVPHLFEDGLQARTDRRWKQGLPQARVLQVLLLQYATQAMELQGA